MKKPTKTPPPKIKASDILRWVADNKKLYPLPIGFDEVFDDITGDGYIFLEHEHCSISKTDFAREYNVPPNYCTRWIQAGMPVESDGRLSWRLAAAWLERERSDWLWSHRRQDAIKCKLRMEEQGYCFPVEEA